MHLIDDRLYKDNILNRQSSIMSLNNTITQNQFADRKYPGQEPNLGYFVKDDPNQQTYSQNSKHDGGNDQKKEKQSETDGVLERESFVTPSMPRSHEKNALKETQTAYDPNQNTKKGDDEIMDIESSPTNDKCRCSEPVKKPANQSHFSKNTKRKIQKEKKTLVLAKPWPKSTQLKDNHDSSDDELRKRLHKIRYDNDNSQSHDDDFKSSMQTSTQQPMTEPETTRSSNSSKKTSSNIDFFCTYCGKRFDARDTLKNHVHKTHPKKKPSRVTKPMPSLEGGKDKISFICSICNSRFKRFQSLSRHMNNIHPDYFGEWFRKNKRANEEPETVTNKKAKWDGRMKRRLESGEESTDKKMKKEFNCFFCNQYFRSKSSLERHEKSIHSPAERIDKRKDKDSDTDQDTYVKRQKRDPKKAIQYSNYF